MITKSSTYQEEPYRFVILTVYLLAAFANSLPVHTFSSINVLVGDKFQISNIEVTLNALLFTIGHPLLALPSNWILNKYGMRVGFIIGAVFIISGVWLRLLLNVGESIYCLIGSGLASCGGLFVLNTPSKVALNWFSKDKANIVTFTGILVTLLSITIGASIPSFLIDKNSSIEEIKNFLFYEAVVITIPFLALVIFFRNEPTEAPSKAAMKVFTAERENYKDLLAKLFKNKQYLKLMVGMTLNYGTLTAFIMILDQMLAGFGYENSGHITSVAIVSAMVAGIFSNPMFSYLLRRTKAYRIVATFGAAGGFIMTGAVCTAFIFKVDNIALIASAGALMGFFLIPLPSILISYASQVVFPIDQSSSAGYLFASSQTFGFLMGLGQIAYLDRSEQHSQVVAYITTGCLLLCIFAVVWVKQDLKKLKFELDDQERKSLSGLKQSLVIQDEGLK